MKKTIRISFTGFWDSFNPLEFYMTRLLKEEYIVEIVATTDSPDFLLFSDGITQEELNSYGRKIRKIYYTFENRKIGSFDCDYAFTFNPETTAVNDSWFRHNGPIQSKEVAEALIKKTDLDSTKQKSITNKKKFCCFVYSHDVKFRNWLFKQISSYKKVDAPGLCMNNMPPIKPRLSEDRFSHFRPGWIDDVIEFSRDYKFCMACENSSTPGYHTEKIIHAMLAGCIPIYWGDPLIHQEFNEKSFVNYHQYERKILAKIPKTLFRIPKIRVLTKIAVQVITTYLMVIEIQKIDNDPELYKKYINEPWYINNLPSFYHKNDRMRERLKIIFG